MVNGFATPGFLGGPNRARPIPEPPDFNACLRRLVMRDAGPTVAA